jgi:tetratricopeptide (TPR) repeat protein
METLKRSFQEYLSLTCRECCLMLPFLLLSISLSGQYNNWDSPDQPAPAPAFDRHYQDGIAAIQVGNVRAAWDHLKAAQQEAADRKDKNDKRKAKDALRRLKSFYAPFYDHLAQGEELLQQRSWKAAQEHFEAAQQLVEKYRKTDLKEVESMDRELADRIEEEVRKADNQRLLAVQEHFRVAEQSLYGGAYDIVLAEMEEARPLLFEEREARELERVRELEDRARYQQLMEAGQTAADKEDFRAALVAYQEARQFMDSYEVQQKQTEIESRLHYELLRQGQEAYLGGRYEEAADLLSEAASFRDSPYYQRIIQNVYSELKANGDAAVEQERYDEAEQWYRRAQLFADGPGIREDIARAGSTAEYEAKYAQALSSIEEENLKRARRQLRRAIREVPNEEARQMIADIDTYFGRIKSGKRLLDEAPAQAWQHFNQAKQLFATGEIEQWLYKAREAAGGQVGPVDPSDFYD